MNVKAYSRGVLFLSIIFLAVVASPPKLSGAAKDDEWPADKARKNLDKYHFQDDDYGCEFCHKKVKDGDFRAPADESELCYECHSDWREARWVHGPIGTGMCSICHYPHGSNKESFLTQNGDELCYFCHDEKRMKPHSKNKGSKNCIHCHDPHGSDSSPLLVR